MDWKTFVASIIGDLAWPVGIISLILILRKPLSSLISSLKRIKWNELELETRDIAHRVELRFRGKLPGEVAENSRTLDYAFRQAATIIRTNNLVDDAWNRLYESILAAVERAGIGQTKPIGVNEALNLLRNRKLISMPDVILVREIYNLYNSLILSSEPISDTTASEFCGAADRLRLFFDEEVGK